MDMSGKQYKILLIFSRIGHSDFVDYTINTIESEIHPYLKFTYLVDPSRNDLERLLQENEYLCIIPCTQYTLLKAENHKYKLNSYIISKLLQDLNLNFEGCTYIPNLILHEKTICSQMSLGIPQPQIITKFNYLSSTASPVERNIKCPILLDPVYINNYISTEKILAHSTFEANEIIRRIFDNDLDVEEICLYEAINLTKNVVVTIMGNPPLSISLVYEYSLEISDGNIVKDTAQYMELLTNSYQLFSEYNFRDFGQFTYTYDTDKNKFNLISINCDNCLDSSVIIAFQSQYSTTGIMDILNVMLLIYLVRSAESNTSIKLIKDIAELLPDTIKESILSFSAKQKIESNYNYKTICAELKSRFLSDDERNRTEFVKYINNCLNAVPAIETPNSVYLGKSDQDYSFLEDYEILPGGPQNAQEVLNTSIQIFNGQMRWHAPSMLYNINPPVMFNTVAATAIAKLYNPNALTRRTSAGFTKMEQQIIRQLSVLLDWNTEQSAGVFTPGGKYCLTYAIKCGLNRCAINSDKHPVVLASEINHFSIESVCEQLGLGQRCIRIPITQEGTIDFDEYKKILLQCFDHEIPIACIIFSGGNTTHCNVENVKKGREILNALIEERNINYMPYIYYDLVVCWPWLFYKYYDFHVNKLHIKPDVLQKIAYTAEIISFVKFADGTGIDFHKGGFCPYSCSIFLSKNKKELYSAFDNTYKINQHILPEPRQYTLGNSRGTSDILSAWNVLQSVGIEGFQSYVANMITVANVFADKLSTYGFTIIEKEHTYGFSTIIWACNPYYPLNYNEFIEKNEETVEENKKYLYALSEFWRTNKEYSCQVRFLPNYTTINNNRRIAVISLLPMTLNIDEEKAVQTAIKLGQTKNQFDQQYLAGMQISTKEMPDNVEK